MRILGLDLETTGLDTAKDRITELGWVLWETDTHTPLLLNGSYLHEPSYPPQTEEIVRLTGITDATLAEFGRPPHEAFGELKRVCVQHRVQYLVAHNGENFDRPFLLAEMGRSHLPSEGDTFGDIPWIDTRNDIPFDPEPESRKLKHLALDAGFINPFAHRAVFDVLTMLRVLSRHDLNGILEYQKIPFVVCRAMVSFQDKDLAKAQRYSWEKIGEKTYAKMWVKKVKLNQLDKEIEVCKKAGFQSVRIE